MYSTLLSAAVVALRLSQTTLAFAIPNSVDLMTRSEHQDDDKIVPFPYDEDDAPEIENSFALIESIPDEIIDQGGQAVSDWIKNYRKGGGGNKPRAFNSLESRKAEPEAEPEANPEPQPESTAVAVAIEKRSWIDVARCALAILQAIAENEIPIAKLRRIKELVKLLGGAKETAKLLLKAKSLKQLLIIGGPELAELGEIFFNYRSIIGACFSFWGDGRVNRLRTRGYYVWNLLRATELVRFWF